MRFFNLSVTVCLLLTIVVFSCKKDHSPAPPTDPGTPGPTRHLDLTCLASQARLQKDTSKKYELIVAETSGKILLDTVTTYNTHVITDLKTSQTLFDVTVIYNWVVDSNYNILTYKAVDISSWVNVPGSDSIPGSVSTTTPPPPTTSGTITYTNVHTTFLDPYFINSNGGGSGSQWTGGDISSSFYYAPGQPVYIIFPFTKLYSIHYLTSSADVVDLSKPDTAVGVKFNKPAVYAYSNFSLFGFPDTTNFSKLVNMSYYATNLGPNPSGDVVYPGKKVVQKYFFDYAFYSADNKNYARCYMPYVDSIPADVVIPDPAWYSFTATPNTVSSDFGTHKPTFYEVNANIGTMYFTITSPADSTVQHPLDFLSSMKSKLLNSRDLSSLKVTSISLATETGLNYQAYCNKQVNLTKISRSQSNTEISYQHIF